MNYSVTIDDGAHNTTIQEFMLLDEASSFFHQQVELFKSKSDDYYKSFLSDDYDAVIELCKLDADGFYEDTLECFDKEFYI